MGQIFTEAEQELESVLRDLADRPRAAVVRLLLMALEREEIVSMAYRQVQIASRLRRMPLPEEARRLIEHAVVWIWKDEEMHTVYARGALLRLGSTWLRLQALAQQVGGCAAGWATSVLHHACWGSAPLSYGLARLIVLAGRAAGKVPREVGRQLHFLPFRDFCLLNAELERCSWLSWDRLALLAERQQMMPEMLVDFHHVAEDEIRHLRVFQVIADSLTPDDQLVAGESADKLGARIAAVGRHFLPHDLRGLEAAAQPISSGGEVWSLAGDAGEAKCAAFRRLLQQADLAGTLHEHARRLGKSASDLRVVVKTCFMLGYHRRDPSPLIDVELVRELAAFLREEGCTDIALAENRNLYDRFFQHRSVHEVACYFDLDQTGFRLVDLSEEQRPHSYARGMGQTTVAESWRDADFRISLGKVRSHPVEMVLASLGNLEGVGGQWDQFLFAERQADRSTALMMILDSFPPHFAVLDCYANVPDGLVGMIGCARPRHPGCFYAGRDAMAVDCVVARHLGMADPGESPLLRAAGHWFGGWPEPIKVIGVDRPLAHWRGPHDTQWHALLSLLAQPVYVWGSGRGSLFVPQMDQEAFPPLQSPSAWVRSARALMRRLVSLRLPSHS